MGIFGNVLKDLAKSAVSDVMKEAAQNEQEESISLVRHAGGPDEKSLNIRIEINCACATLPLYVCRVIESTARFKGISYENMVDLASVYHELSSEVSDQTVNVVKNEKEGSSED